MNETIKAANVRLIGESREMLGVITKEEAISLAQAAGVDLVCISPDADPPVCRLVDYSKFRYEQEKKAAEVKKKMAAAKQELKELKMSYKIDTHDYDVRLRAAKKFLSKGDRVKVVCLLKGREVEFKSIALEMFNRFLDDTKEDGSVDGKPMMEGRSMVMTIKPNKAPAVLAQEKEAAERKKQKAAARGEAGADESDSDIDNEALGLLNADDEGDGEEGGAPAAAGGAAVPA